MDTVALTAKVEAEASPARAFSRLPGLSGIASDISLQRLQQSSSNSMIFSRTTVPLWIAGRFMISSALSPVQRVRDDYHDGGSAHPGTALQVRAMAFCRSSSAASASRTGAPESKATGELALSRYARRITFRLRRFP